MKVTRGLVLAFFIFPFNVMGTVPALILWLTQEVIEFDLLAIVGGFF